jgi:hypothetical protein
MKGKRELTTPTSIPMELQCLLIFTIFNKEAFVKNHLMQRLSFIQKRNDGVVEIKHYIFFSYTSLHSVVFVLQCYYYSGMS